MEVIDAKILKISQELLLIDSSKQNKLYIYQTGYLSGLIFARLQCEKVDQEYHKFLEEKLVDLQAMAYTCKESSQTTSVPLEILKPGKIEKVRNFLLLSHIFSADKKEL